MPFPTLRSPRFNNVLANPNPVKLISGTASIAISQSATLTNAVAITGSSAISFTASGTIVKTYPITSLTDDFSTIDSTKWDSQSASVVSNEAFLEAPFADSAYLHSVKTYEYRGYSFYFKVISGDLSISAGAYPYWCSISVDISGSGTANISDGLTTTNVSIPSPVWFRVNTDSTGTFTVDTSSDGSSWTTGVFTSAPHRLEVGKVNFNVGFPNAATVDNFNVAPGSVTSISGSSSITLGSSGTLANAVAISGSSSITLSQSATLANAVAISGSSSISFSSSATLANVVVISGSTSISLGSSATLANVVAISGSSSITLAASNTDLSRSRTIGGSSSITISQTGTISRVIPISGSSSIALSASNSSLIRSRQIAGSSAIALTGAIQDVPSIPIWITTPGWIRTRLIDASTEIDLSASSSVTKAILVSGTSDVTLSTFVQDIPSIPIWTTTPGYLRTRLIDGSGDIELDAEAYLIQTEEEELGGASSITLQATATLSQAVGLSGTAALVLSATATVVRSESISGASALTLTGAGSLSRARSLLGSSALVIAGSSSLYRTRILTGSSALQLLATGSILRSRQLVGTTLITITGITSLKKGVQVSGSTEITIYTYTTLRLRRIIHHKAPTSDSTIEYYHAYSISVGAVGEGSESPGIPSSTSSSGVSSDSQQIQPSGVGNG